MRGSRRPLWRCPKCGHRFVTRNLWHSCTNHTLAEHFKGKPPALRRLFDRYLAVVRRNGPVTVIPQKSRIAFQVKVRFAGAIIRAKWIEGAMWLRRRVSDQRFHRVEAYTPRDFGHYFRISRAEDLDATLATYLAEAYAIGRREHLDSKPAAAKRSRGRRPKNVAR